LNAPIARDDHRVENIDDIDLILRSRQISGGVNTDRALQRAASRGELERVVRGVYSEPQPGLTPEQRYLRRIVAVAARTKGRRVLSHQSAALLHGIDLLGRDYAQVHFTVDRGAARTKAVYLHRANLLDEDIVEVGSVRVTSMARTVADIACATDFAGGLAAVDSGLRLGVPRAQLDDLALRLTGSKGIANFRNSLVHADEKAETAGESLSRARMIEMGDIPLPRLQHEFYLPCGSFLARSDFDWEGKVIGEFDGIGKYTADGQDPNASWHAERERHNRLLRHGFVVMRWDWKILQDRRRFRALLRDGLRTAGII
jgi:predicted transcriptional regulator of viral defense system